MNVALSRFLPLAGSLFLLAITSLSAGRQVVVLIDPNDPCRATAVREVLPQLGTLDIGDGIKIWDSSSPRALYSLPAFRRNPMLDLEPFFKTQFKLPEAISDEPIPSAIPDAEPILVAQLAKKYYEMTKTRALPPVDIVIVSSPLFIYAEGVKTGRYSTVDGKVPNANALWLALTRAQGYRPSPFGSSLAEGIVPSQWGLRASWIYPETLMEQAAEEALAAFVANSGEEVSGGDGSSLATDSAKRWLERELGRMWATYLGQHGIRLVHFGSSPVMPWQEVSPVEPWSQEEIRANSRSEMIAYGEDIQMPAEAEPTEFEAVLLEAPWKSGSDSVVEKLIPAGAIEKGLEDYVKEHEALGSLVRRSKALVAVGVASKAGSKEINEKLARGRAQNLGLALRQGLNLRLPIYGQSLGQYIGSQEDQQYQRGLLVIGLTSGEDDILANPLLLQKALAEWDTYPVDRSDYSEANLFPVR